MQISITNLKGESATLRIKKELPVDYGDRGLTEEKLVSPLKLDVTVTNTEEGYSVQGSVQTKVELECTRCLIPFVYDLSAEFSDEYLPKLNRAETEDDRFFSEQAPYFQGDQLDITELINESLILAIPMKLICSTDCTGLCSHCGQNLNQNSCQCIVDTVDPRLAALTDLLKKE